jgi:hypothetical protein
MAKKKWLSVFVVLTMLLSLALAMGATASDEPSYTEQWDGRGTDSRDCSKVGQEGRPATGWIHWVFSTKGESTSAELVLGGTGSGTYAPGEPLNAEVWHFYTPYFELDGLDATINLYGGDPGPGGGLVISDYCPGVNATLEYEIDLDYEWTAEWEWDIEKTVTPAKWDLFKGDTGTSRYTVSVTKEMVDEDSRLYGDFSVTNISTTVIAYNVNVDLQVYADGVAMPGKAASFPLGDLAIGASAGDDFEFEFPFAAGVEYTVKMDVTLNNGGPYDDSASVSPTIDIDGFDEVTVVDSYAGNLGTFNASGSTSYDRTFDCAPQEEDEYTEDMDGFWRYHNTAEIVETGDSDDASVDVYCYELEVTKDADTDYTRTYEWTIEKVGDQDELTLSEGQQFQVNYTVTVDATYEDSDWAVSGKIWVYNPAPMAAIINSVTDVVSPTIAANVTGATFPYTLAAGGTLELSYSAALPDATSRTNTATAVQQNYDYDWEEAATASGTTSYSGTADVIFGDPTEEIDECIDVTDDLAGYLGTVCFNVNDLPYDFNYSMYVGPFYTGDQYKCGGWYEFINTACFETNDTGTEGCDSWTVSWIIPCPGCTLTPGYWKTHSKYGPAPYDETWALIGEDTIFFKSGKTYYQALWTTPAGGNAYYILAHAYIAAELNFLNGADSTAVQTVFDAVKVLLQTYTPAQVGAWKGNNTKRALFLTYAKILDDYNNGKIGPGHCSE